MSYDCNAAFASICNTQMPERSPLRPPSITKGKNESKSVTNQLSPFLIKKQCKMYPEKSLYDVFLGGSCGSTVWRRDLVIPYLEKRAITYYDPQRSVWNEHMINEESIAKERSSLFLFVLDPATVNATSFLEIAHFAARKAPKLVVVFLGQSEWRDKGHPDDVLDRQRTCDLIDAILSASNVPALKSIKEALKYIDQVIIGEKTWSEAMSNPLQRLPYIMLRGQNAVKQSLKRVRTAWNTVKCGIGKWKGMGFVFIGICEVLIVLAIHFFLHSLPIALLFVLFLAFDVFVVFISLIYYRYKAMEAQRNHAKLLKLHVYSQSLHSAVPGCAVVPCNIVSEQLPLNYTTHFKSNRVGTKRMPMKALKNAISKSKSKASNVNHLKQQFGYDVFLACSSRSCVELMWVSQIATPLLQKKGISFSSELLVEKHKRMYILEESRRILYHIPSCNTVLSGMVEVAYLLGHANRNVTLCVPKSAVMLVCSTNNEEIKQRIDQRNECYRMALCYLKDMAERRHCEVFSHLDDALHYIISCSKR